MTITGNSEGDEATVKAHSGPQRSETQRSETQSNETQNNETQSSEIRTVF